MTLGFIFTANVFNFHTRLVFYDNEPLMHFILRTKKRVIINKPREKYFFSVMLKITRKVFFYKYLN